MSNLANTLLNKVFATCFIVFALIGPLTVTAQDRPILEGKKYKIGGIEVTGSTTYNESTIITYTGLRVGEEIYLPGDKISAVVKKLWKLNLFSDINFYITKIEGDTAFLELNIAQVPELEAVKVEGVKKAKQKEFIKDNDLKKGAKVTENLITTTKNYIANSFRKNGFLNAKVNINTIPVKDTIEDKDTNRVKMVVLVDKGDRVKVDHINITGNEQLSNGKIKKAMKNTKQKMPLRFWKRSKYTAADYEEDKDKIIAKDKEKGYRDARITSDSLAVEDDNSVTLHLNVEEGNKYYFGNINFLGNSIFSDRDLARKLIIKKGDVYNGILLEKRIADNTRPDADDLTNLYQNSGYLFSSINPVEVNVQNDTIDFEIRVREGKLAHFNHITVTGNTKTNDHVIFREIRTKPGQQYSKELVVRTVRELGQLGFFDPEQLNPQFKNVDPNSGTLDIEYEVVEKGASQIELQGGFGGTGFVGTLGLSFNNFSIRNIFKKEAYKPLPMGDGQSMSLRAQASTFFRTYSLSFVEPWLGGKKPFQLSTSFSHSTQFSFQNQNLIGSGRATGVDRSRRFDITGATVGIAKRLKWPDNYFTFSQAISYQHYKFTNYNIGLFTFGNGNSNNLAYTIGLSRDNTYTNPIFPMGGSKFSFTAKMTLPYSAFNGVDYGALANERADIVAGNTDLTVDERNTRIGEIDQERFKWLEFYKIKFKSEWYTKMVGKLVLKTTAEYGFMGAYNNDRGIPPFERFFLGGDGLGAQSLDGREVVALRGYPNQSITPLGEIRTNQDNNGATIYNKYSLEMRYPITLKPAASIYALTFLEGGATYDSFRGFNPFQLNRSAGVGLRIFMPAFGLLGIDFGYRFDPIPGTNDSKTWETHFIIGQQF